MGQKIVSHVRYVLAHCLLRIVCGARYICRTPLGKKLDCWLAFPKENLSILRYIFLILSHEDDEYENMIKNSRGF
jgi:hypothetical protein